MCDHTNDPNGLWAILNRYECLLNAEKFIMTQTIIKPREQWGITWTADNQLYLNKRTFIIHIDCVIHERTVFCGCTYSLFLRIRDQMFLLYHCTI